MVITPFGIVTILLGLALLVTGRRRALFYLLVFSFPFFWVAALRVGEVVVRPYYCLGAMLMLRQLIDRQWRLTIGGRLFRFERPIFYLMTFIAVAYASLIMPIVLEGHVDVVSMHTGFMEYYATEPLAFSVRNITQIVYPTFAVMLMLSIVVEVDSLATVRKAMRLTMAATFVVLATGLAYQLAIVAFGPGFIPMMTRLVMGSDEEIRVVGNTVGYKSFASLPRMFSLAGEASYSALLFVFSLGFMMGLSFRTFSRDVPPRGNLLVCLILTMAVVITGSTTGILGLACLLLSLYFVHVIRGIVSPSQLLVSIVALALAMAVLGTVLISIMSIATGGNILDYIVSEHVNKVLLMEGSTDVRAETIAYTISDVFMKSPILGVGYGSHRSASLLVALLSNVGLAGTLAFVLFNVAVIRQGLAVLWDARYPELQVMAYALLIAMGGCFPVIVATQGLNGLMFGWYWLTMASLMALYRERAAHHTSTSTASAGGVTPSPLRPGLGMEV
jgi:hypothetical protein